MARKTPPFCAPLHANEFFLAEFSRTLVRGDHTQTYSQGVFKSIQELVDVIEEYIRYNNEDPKPFVWTKKVEQILEKVNCCKGVIETAH